MTTRRRAGISIAVLLVGLLAILVSGCGSGSSSSSTSSASSASTTASQNEGEGAKEFLIAGKKNEIPKLGKEGSVSEREEASKILEESLEARQAHDWAGQCATLSARGIKTMEESSPTKGKKGCTAVLGAQGESAPAAILKNNMAAPVGALRVKGNKGFALYHGTDKKDWVMPMEKEGGEWKVGALVATQLPGS